MESWTLIEELPQNIQRDIFAGIKAQISTANNEARDHRWSYFRLIFTFDNLRKKATSKVESDLRSRNKFIEKLKSRDSAKDEQKKEGTSGSKNLVSKSRKNLRKTKKMKTIPHSSMPTKPERCWKR